MMKYKNRMIVLFMALFAVALLVGCGGPSAGEEGISAEEAKTIALEHSGISAADASFVRTEYDLEDRCYEIQFYADNVEYDYDIDSVTGDIRSYDSEIEGFTIGDSVSPVENGTEITEEEAKSIALNHAGFAESEVKGLFVTKDFDDGVTVFEVEFRDGFTEYSYDIDAATGEILSYDIDND